MGRGGEGGSAIFSVKSVSAMNLHVACKVERLSAPVLHWLLGSVVFSSFFGARVLVCRLVHWWSLCFAACRQALTRVTLH